MLATNVRNEPAADDGGAARAADESVDEGHPLRRQVRSAKHGYAYDRIPEDTPVCRLYESDDLTAFIAAVLGRDALGKDALYRSADPLDGDESDLLVLPSSPGSLAFFRGEHALHHVTPVEGGRPRINSVLTYGVRPDMRLSDSTSETFYGRTSS